MTVLARFPLGIAGAREPGAQTWINLVWECNTISSGFFGAPQYTGDWWAGGTVEEYGQARIVRDTSSVRIIGSSARGDLVIAEAAERLGVHVQDAP